MLKGKKVEEGAYGKVYVAVPDSQDDDDGVEYALKRNIVEDEVDFAGNMREVDFLLRLKKHPNIVNIEHIIYGDPFVEDINPSGRMSPVKDGYKDDMLHFAMEYAELDDLHKFIHDPTSRMSLPHIKPLIVDALLGLEYIHHNTIIHRDIKPANFLLFDNGEDQPPTLKVCDFGLSKYFTKQEPQTPSMVTAWYRAPEIAMGCEDYDYKVDVWSLGCVIYQMITKKGFVECRNDDKEILASILKQLPKRLPPSETRKLKEKYNIRLPRGKRKGFHKDLFPTPESSREFEEYVGDPKLFVDMVESMLQFFPSNRSTVTQILDNPFFDDCREKIVDMRSEYILSDDKKCFSDDDLTINVCDVQERKWATNFAIYFYKKYISGEVKWYKHRIIFQAIDLFDRYLEYIHISNKTPLKQKSTEKIFEERVQTEIRFLTCVYISIKYFATLETPISYLDISEELFSVDGTKEFAQNFEKELLEKVFKYLVYRPTVFECADFFDDVMTENDIVNLLWAYSICPEQNNVHIRDLYKSLVNVKIPS